MIKLLVTAIYLVLQPKIMEWTEPVQKLFLQHCAIGIKSFMKMW